MRKGDIFRIVAIDDESFDLARLRQLAAQAENPRCVVEGFACIDDDLIAALRPPLHLVILDDELSAGCRGEHSLRVLRDAGYAGPVAILSGLRRPHRNPDLVRAGAMYYQAKDDLDLAAFLGLVDMAMAVGDIMRARRREQPIEGRRADAAGWPVRDRRTG